jgi:hypothetical protein
MSNDSGDVTSVRRSSRSLAINSLMDWLKLIRALISNIHTLKNKKWTMIKDKFERALTFEDLPSAARRIPPLYLQAIMVVPSVIAPPIYSSPCDAL